MRRAGIGIKALYLSLLVILSTKGWAFGEQESRITLEMRNVSLKEVLLEIEKQSGIIFIYNAQEIENLSLPSIAIKDKSVTESLDIVLKGSKLGYRVDGRVIHIALTGGAKPKKEAVATKATVSGFIHDSNGDPLYGATIREEGSNNFAVAGDNGEYSIAVEFRPGLTLSFTFIGMKTEYVEVNGREKIDVRMDFDQRLLKEVVVTGYGNITKEAYTGSASTIGSEKLETRPVSTFTDALKGISPGVVITGVGQPGEAQTVRLRGTSSMNASNQPLYVIDGVVWEQENISGSAGYPSDPMNTLNPSDIASITLLRDAASASLYGSRGANGVIVITTKQGMPSEKVNYNFNLQTGVASILSKPDFVNGREFANLWAEGEMHALIKGATSENDFIPELKKIYADKQNYLIAGKNYNEWYKQAQLNFNQYYKIPKPDGTFHNYDFFGIDYDRLPNIDWFDQVTRLAPFEKYSLAIYGGTPQIRYYLSTEYFNQEGIIINSKLNRYAVRFKLSSDNPKSFLNWGTNLYVATTKQSGPRKDGQAYNMPQYAAVELPPVVPPYLDDGNYNFRFPNNLLNTNHNPMASAELNLNGRSLLNITASAYGQLNLREWLKFKSSVTLYYLYAQRKEYFDKDFGTGYASGGNLLERDANRQKFVNSNMLFIDKNFNDIHTINAAVGTEFEDFTNIDHEFNLKGFLSDDLPYVSLGSEVTGWAGGGYGFALFSLISRFDYSYRYKYYLSGSFRRDKSSRFAPSQRAGNFWSISGAWRLINEPWMKGARKVMNDFKVKTSYGINGTLPLAYYSWRSIYAGTASYMSERGIYSSLRPEESLTWEKNRVFNIGLDLAFDDSRYKLTVEYFYRKTSDLLQNFPVSRTSGYSSILMNTSAGIENSGLEFDLSARLIDKKVKLDLSYNLATLKSRYYGLEIDDISTQIMRNGEKVAAWYLFEWAGIDPESGRNLYYTYDQDGNRSGTSTAASQRLVVGTGIPLFTGGATLSLTYKNWDFSTLFTYAGGHHIFDRMGQSLTRRNGGGQYTVASSQLDRWTPDNIYTNNVLRVNGNLAEGVSTKYLSKGDYLKLKNIKLQYLLPRKAAKSIGAARASLFVQADNLWILTEMKDYDPEMQLMGYRFSDRYPTATTYTIGAQIRF
ncbi:MAG: SusC/RagA family TonB-linked outer membrane protein [Bacteroidales bacterium]